MGRNTARRGEKLLRSRTAGVDVSRMVRLYGAEVAVAVLQHLMEPAPVRFKRSLSKRAAS